MLPLGIKPASVNCRTTTLTTGSLAVTDKLLLKDHVRTELRKIFGTMLCDHPCKP